MLTTKETLSFSAEAEFTEVDFNAEAEMAKMTNLSSKLFWGIVMSGTLLIVSVYLLYSLLSQPLLQ